MPTITVTEDDDNRRLDRILRKAYPDVPPGALARAIRRGAVRRNDARCRNNDRVHTGDTITVPAWRSTGGPEHRFSSSPSGLSGGRLHTPQGDVPILKRTNLWLAVNKPPGMVTHGKGSLEEGVRDVAHHQGWWAPSLSFRPGPVHRLDRNTGGVQLFALSTEGARVLSNELRERHTVKLYLALLQGSLATERVVDMPMRYDHDTRRSRPGSLEAVTRLIPLAVSGTSRTERTTLIAAIPETGRTHQIRFHAGAIGYPLRGDTKYGGTPNPGGYVLHALVLAMPRLSETWYAPLHPETIERLGRDYPNLADLGPVLRDLLPAACTGIPGNDTILA